jgi:hypothetical protein
MIKTRLHSIGILISPRRPMPTTIASPRPTEPTPAGVPVRNQIAEPVGPLITITSLRQFTFEKLSRCDYDMKDLAAGHARCGGCALSIRIDDGASRSVPGSGNIQAMLHLWMCEPHRDAAQLQWSIRLRVARCGSQRLISRAYPRLSGVMTRCCATRATSLSSTSRSSFGLRSRNSRR